MIIRFGNLMMSAIAHVTDFNQNFCLSFLSDSKSQESLSKNLSETRFFIKIGFILQRFWQSLLFIKILSIWKIILIENEKSSII